VAENGTGSFATNSILNANFVPSGANDWCFIDASPGCFSIDLSQFDGQPNVMIKFVAQSNGGNNIYLDNVELSGICSGNPTASNTAGFIVSAQQICEGQTVTYTDQSAGNPVSWNWTFPGGIPGNSVQQNPTVTYNPSGTYNVQLIATNANG